jgi:hypothetical protein
MNLTIRKLGKTEKKKLKEYIKKNGARMFNEDCLSKEFSYLKDLAYYNGISIYTYMEFHKN